MLCLVLALIMIDLLTVGILKEKSADTLALLVGEIFTYTQFL